MTLQQSIRDQVNDLVRSVTDNANMLLTTPLLVDFFDGDHNAALMLNQVLYWTDRTTDPNGWFYKTHHDWFAELRFSPYQIRRVVIGDERITNPKRNLSEVGLETQVRMAPNGRNATFYRLDLPQFMGMFVDWLENRFGQIVKSQPHKEKRRRRSKPQRQSHHQRPSRRLFTNPNCCRFPLYIYKRLGKTLTVMVQQLLMRGKLRKVSFKFSLTVPTSIPT